MGIYQCRKCKNEFFIDETKTLYMEIAKRVVKRLKEINIDLIWFGYGGDDLQVFEGEEAIKKIAEAISYEENCPACRDSS